MATCAVPACGQMALRYRVFHGTLHHFCPEHHVMAVRVHRELPMAIQEFHAWALLNTTEHRAPVYLTRAKGLVLKLRAMEDKLEGAK
jgi:hypothetical protein